VSRRLSGWALLGIWMLLLWVLLWGSLAPAVLLSAVVVVPLCLLAARLPPEPLRAAPRWGRVPGALWRFTVDLVTSSAQLTVAVLRRDPPATGAIVALQVPRGASDMAWSLAANRLSLVPGTVVIDMDRPGGRMYVYTFDVSDQDEAEAARRSAADAVGDVMRAMGEDHPDERSEDHRGDEDRAGGGRP
jgi:multicomponent Na+:H+ antiporter subunit E